MRFTQNEGLPRTYYKHFSAESSPRIKENQYIASLILHIYADYNKRLGAYKITYVLQRDYGINISVGRVYRLVISWHISSKANVELVITAFKNAYEKRNAPYGLMFHSDRGSQYTAFTFRQLLDSLNVVQSFSKKGYPFDNACCECFFKYLKKEETNRKCYRSLMELQLSVFEYIEGYYNTKRPHGTLNMLTPNEAEALYWEQTK